MRLIYSAGRQGTKVRFLVAFSLVCALGAAWWGLDMARTYGQSPADGGVLAPLAVRLAWGVGIFAAGALFLIGMLIYGRCYVMAMRIGDARTTVQIDTLRFLMTASDTMSIEDVKQTRSYDRSVRGRATPALMTKVGGRRLPLIIDLQGDLVEPDMIDEVLGTGPAS